MSNALFDPGREGILDRTIDMTASTIKVALVRGYTFTSSHKFLSDVQGAGGSVVGTAQALTSKSYTNGVFNAANPNFSAVPSGSAIGAVVIFNDTGTASTSRVVAFIDSAGGTLPATPNGGDIGITWDTGANKIFKL